MNFGVTYYSIGALILSFFNLYLILSSFGKKTNKFYTKILNYFFIFFLPTNLSFLFASIFIHPIFAYYRWFTVPSVFISYSFLIFFILIYKEETVGIKYLIKKYLFIALLSFSIIITLYFYMESFNQKTVYFFSGHNYELLVPAVNKIIFNSLVGMLAIMFLSVLYRTLNLIYIFFRRNPPKELNKKEIFLSVLLLWLLFLTQLIPTITNILSVYKIIDRGFHYLIFVTTIVLGFSIVFFLYINLEKEESSILYKINSISIITLLLITQFITYLMLKDIETNFIRFYQTKYENFLANFHKVSLDELTNVERPLLIFDSINKNFLYIDNRYQQEKFLENINNIEKSENKGFFYQIQEILVLRFALSDNKVVYVSNLLLRDFLNRYSFRIFVLLFVFIVIVLAFFPFFYKTEIVKSIEELIEKIEIIQKTNDYSIQVKKFFNDELGIVTDSFNKMISDLKVSYTQLLEYSKELEQKVQERTEELNEQITIIKKLKEQQDGDYFLTSLLTRALTKKEIKEKTTLNIFSYLRQAKEFEFKNKKGQIGGDNIIIDKIYIYNQSTRKIESYIFGAISDSLGSSMQGACGSIVFSVLLFSYLRNLKKQIIQENETNILKECYYILQKIFLTFNGEMTCSCILFIINESTKVIYYINADFPNTTIINFLKEGEIIEIKNFEDDRLPSLGIQHERKLRIHKSTINDNEKLIFHSDGINYLELVFNEKKYTFFNIIKELKKDFYEIIHLIENKTIQDDISLLVFENKKNFFDKKFPDDKLVYSSLRLIRNRKNEFLFNLLSKLEHTGFFHNDILVSFAISYYFKKSYKISRSIMEFLFINNYKDLSEDELLLLMNLFYKTLLKTNNIEEISKKKLSAIIINIFGELNNKEYSNSKINYLRRLFIGLSKRKFFSEKENKNIQEILNTMLKTKQDLKNNVHNLY